MADDPVSIWGVFTNEDQAASMISDLKNSPWTFVRAHSPIPGNQIKDALKLKKSSVGWFTLTGGILGFLSGFGLAIFTATRWSIIVGGKPVVALIPFIIVGFEFTILFSVLGNVIGLLTQIGLPRWKLPDYYDPRCSGTCFGVLATCRPDQQTELGLFFTDHGAEVKTINYQI